MSSTMAMGLRADLLVALSMKSKADDRFAVTAREVKSGLTLDVDEGVSGSFLDRHNESINCPQGALGLYATCNTELIGRTVEAIPSEYSGELGLGGKRRGQGLINYSWALAPLDPGLFH